jgi:hypothetical protein
VVFLPGDQLVAQVEGNLGGTGGGGSGGQDAGNEQPSAAREFVGLRVGLGSVTGLTRRHRKKPRVRQHRGQSRPPTRELSALIALLRAEVAQLKVDRRSHTPSSSHAHAPQADASKTPSSGGGTPQAILQTTSTNLVVTVDLPASMQSEAVRGERVTVEMPAGNTVGGRVSAVSRVAQSSSNSGSGSGSGSSGGSGSGSAGSGSGGGSPSIPVTIALDHPPAGAGLDQAAVSVDFAQQRARHVLSVPVTALLATSGQTYAVQEADSPHHLIPVSTGLFAAGYVQISGPGLSPGLRVTDSQG